MRRDGRGFTLVEVMVTLLLLGIIVMATFSLFINMLQQYKQQSKLAETGTERMMGLELLRQDLEHAGFGLPWNFTSTVNYTEAAATTYNDAPSNVPRAILDGNDTEAFGSDRIVVKSANVGMDNACGKWTLLPSTGTPRGWSPSTENMASGDQVIVLDPGSTDSNRRSLALSVGAFGATFPPASGFAPTVSGMTRIVYGVRDTGSPGSMRMPFNRAEYYIDTSSVPQTCAPNTGVLVKRVLQHQDGQLGPSQPLLDCVADMEIEFGRDTDNDGAIDATTDDVSAFDAATIRDSVKEIRVYLLAQEGQRDPAYVHPVNPINVRGQNVNVDVNYRWRLYTLVVKPTNLRD